MAESDWDTVTYLRKRPAKGATAKSSQVVNDAMRKGQDVETHKKWSAGTNKQRQAAVNATTVDGEVEDMHRQTVSLDVGRLIQQGRQNKKMAQKDLAVKINEKPQVVNDYEAGRAVPSNQILGKLERVLGMKLRGKDKGQPLTMGPKK